MKKLILFIAVFSLMATGASATGTGLRAGITSGPDQLHVGAHTSLGHLFPLLRLAPSIEIGMGDNTTLISFNGDLIYDVPHTGFGVGGELALQYLDYDSIGSDTELGMSALANFRMLLDSGNSFLLEAKIGLLDAPDFKLTVGYDFF